jgi:hypothetical protein
MEMSKYFLEENIIAPVSKPLLHENAVTVKYMETRIKNDRIFISKLVGVVHVSCCVGHKN